MKAGVSWKPLLHRQKGVTAEIKGALKEDAIHTTDHAEAAVAERLAPRRDLGAGRLNQPCVPNIVDPLCVSRLAAI
jgi:hypothetical protein